MIDHWLFGKCKFEKEIEKETDCTDCLCNEVCSHDVSERCVNYHLGDSREKHCEACDRHFSRYDSRQPIPCFYCKDLKKAQEA